MNKKVKCIEQHNHLTKGKIYELMHTYYNQIKVINDEGFEEYFDRNIFEIVSI